MKTRAEEGRRGARKGGRNVGEEREKRKDRLIVTNTDPGLPNYKLTSWANFLPFSPIAPPPSLIERRQLPRFRFSSPFTFRLKSNSK